MPGPDGPDRLRVQRKRDSNAKKQEVIFDPRFATFVVRTPPGSRFDIGRLLPRRPVLLSVLSLLFVSVVALVSWFGLDFTLFETVKRFSGANVDRSFPIAFLTGVFGSVVIVIVRKRRRLLVAGLLLAAVSLSVALAFVELDRASVRESVTDTWSGTTTTDTRDYSFLYLLWGVPLASVLLQTCRVWGKQPRARLVGLFVPFVLWFTGFAIAGRLSPVPSVRGPGETACWKQLPGTADLAGAGDVYAISALSPTDLWAVGQRNADGQIPGGSLAIHWDGQSLHLIQSAGSQDSPLYALSAVSPTDVWAAGGDTKPLVEHWNGRTWEIIPTPNLQAHSAWFTAIAARSNTDVWAAGLVKDPVSHPLLERWDGKRWKVELGETTPGSLFGIAVRSATDVWVVGRRRGETLIEHWDGHAWRRLIATGTDVSGTLTGVAAFSATNVWLVGYTRSAKTLIEHWNGRRLSVVRSVNGGETTLLRSISAASPTDLWAWGVTRRSNSERTPFLEHWSGGRWQALDVPSVTGVGFGSVAVGSHDEIWSAVNIASEGAFATTDAPIIEQYSCAAGAAAGNNR